ncbi:MAG TPA: alpha/beta fold hydrolase [Gemmataceae bacterium]|nr:alpha/beta fold hydrolase [Gemmataceae bacterium]
MKAKRFMLIFAVAVACGCTEIGVRPVHAPDFLSSWRANIQQPDGLSVRTLQTLRQYDLDRLVVRKPEEVAAQMHEMVVRDPRPELLYALAELHCWLGRQAEKVGKPLACHHYYLCAGYAYHYLFGAANAQEVENLLAVSAFDPRFRLACDLYNASLTKCIRAAQKVGKLDPAKPLYVQTADGQGFTLSVAHHGFAWRPEEFGPLLFCEDFRVEGLSNQYRTYGLGVPLIGERPPGAPPAAHASYPRNLQFPVTAFFQFPGDVANLAKQHSGMLDLYNPNNITWLSVHGGRVPLETDLTTPLAYFLAHTGFGDASYDGLLRPDKVQVNTGIYMFEPYQPGKIPVLLIHGLFSSPLTWAPLINDLQADPELRERYQFWAYLYPTADPYLVTAADLRQRLSALRNELDPQGRDPALSDMVLVGHSMGGLIAKLLTTRSRDAKGNELYWRLLTKQVTPEAFAKLQIRPQTKEELQRTFFFDEQPYIRRVIFLATPHHGSSLSPSWPARFINRFVRLPNTLTETLTDLARSDPKAWPMLAKGDLPTSIEMLKPGAEALELLAAEPRPPQVHFNSVVGVLHNPGYLVEHFSPGGRSKEGTDGVVPYESAHLPEADTELVVPADHFNVHHHPRAVLEVRRLLHEHLREAEAQAIVPVSLRSVEE